MNCSILENIKTIICNACSLVVQELVFILWIVHIE